MAHTRSASFRVRISVRCGAQKRAGDERVLSVRTPMVGANAGPPKQPWCEATVPRVRAYCAISEICVLSVDWEKLSQSGKGRYEHAMWKVAGLEEAAAQAAKGGMGAEHGAGEVEEGGVDAYAAGGAFRHDGGATADAEAAAIAAGNVRR